MHGVKILYDTQDLISNKLRVAGVGADETEKPRWNQEEGVFLDWFLWMFRQIYCWTLQARLKPEKAFDKLYMAQGSLKTVRDKLLGMEIFLYGHREYLNKINPELASKLANTFVPLEVPKMLTAVKDLIVIYDDIGNKYALKTGEAFPKEKLRILENLLADYDSVSVAS